MSRGPGAIENRIADLFAATRDRALSVDDLANDAFELEGRPATRAQRLSAIRAAHRVIRRVLDMEKQRDLLERQIEQDVRAQLGRDPGEIPENEALLDRIEALRKAHPLSEKAERLWKRIWAIGTWSRWERQGRGIIREVSFDTWCATTIGKGRASKLWFHPADCPVQVWAVRIDQTGVHWFDAEVVRVTERNVIVHYGGDVARLSRKKLWHWWAFWRGVKFVAHRTGRIAAALEGIWRDRYAAAGSAPPPAMQMPLAEAIALLGVPTNYTRDDVVAAFRRAVKRAHPDVGGTAEQFRKLVGARDRLLAALGTSAPPPKMPAYYERGVKAVYSSRVNVQRRLTASKKLVAGE